MSSETNEIPAIGKDLAGDQQRITVESQTDSVKIKQLIPEDAQAYFDLIDFDRKHLSQSHERKDRPDVTAAKYDTVEKVLDSIVNQKHPGKLRFGIWDGDMMVGSVNLVPLKGDGVAESGSWVGKQHIGSNYATRARNLMIEHAFETLGLQELVSNVEVGNIASRKSVEKSDFEFVGEEEGLWKFSLKNPNL